MSLLDGSYMLDAECSTARPRRGWFWPALIIGFLSIHASVWLVFTLIAVRDPSFSVEPDSYRKSLEWDATAARARASAAIGWSVAIETDPAPAVSGDRRLACRILDREGNPVMGAAVELTMFHHARGSRRVEAVLAEEGPGVYAARLPMRKPGLWECRIAARSGDVLFARSVLHEVPAPGGRP